MEGEERARSSLLRDWFCRENTIVLPPFSPPTFTIPGKSARTTPHRLLSIFVHPDGGWFRLSRGFAVQATPRTVPHATMRRESQRTAS